MLYHCKHLQYIDLDTMMLPIYVAGVLSLVSVLNIVMLRLMCSISCTTVCREEEAEDISPASLVLSSQILGYDGQEVDSSENVTINFPINVRHCFCFTCM